jgi:hypothetical protein
MTVQADHFHVLQPRGPLVYPQGLVGGDPELVFAQPGGYLRVGLGVHIGVYAH